MQTPGANRKGSITVYVVMSLLIAASGSLFNPVLSFFLSTELGFDPIHISIFFILLPIATIVIVQTVARFSDMGLQRPSIICIASLFGIASATLLYLRPNFWVMCSLGLLFLASYPVSFPQIFASAREFAVKHVKSSVMFTTFLRALISLSWVVGPPLSYAIALGVSFDALFLVSGTMFVLCGVTSFFFLPNVMEKSIADKGPNVQWWKNGSVLLLFIAFACMFTAFSSYITTMPLYITQELKLENSLPGFIMGLAAFIEIPLMFLAARLSKRFGLKIVILVGGISLVAFLIILPFAVTKEQILSLQILPALFIGLLATMGMVYFQDLLPSIPGQATSLFINASTAGQIAGGALISLAASGTYTIIFAVGAVTSAVGSFILLFVKKPEISST